MNKVFRSNQNKFEKNTFLFWLYPLALIFFIIVDTALSIDLLHKKTFNEQIIYGWLFFFIIFIYGILEMVMVTLHCLVTIKKIEFLKDVILLQNLFNKKIVINYNEIEEVVISKTNWLMAKYGKFSLLEKYIYINSSKKKFYLFLESLDETDFLRIFSKIKPDINIINYLNNMLNLTHGEKGKLAMFFFVPFLLYLSLLLVFISLMIRSVILLSWPNIIFVAYLLVKLLSMLVSDDWTKKTVKEVQLIENKIIIECFFGKKRVFNKDDLSTINKCSLKFSTGYLHMYPPNGYGLNLVFLNKYKYRVSPHINNFKSLEQLLTGLTKKVNPF